MKDNNIENKEEEEEDFAEEKGYWSSFLALLGGYAYGIITLGFTKIAFITCVIGTLLAIATGWYSNRD